MEKHWPTVARWRDIRTLTGENFYERTGLRTVDIISGGFPCQPFSVAGKRRSKEDDRYLWPEMLRVIEEIRPTWVVGENVAGIVTMALDQVLSDLEGIGYACQAFIIPACAVDAPHRRDRCAIVAHRNSVGLEAQGTEQSPTGITGSGANVANADCDRLEKQGMQGLSEEPRVPAPDSGWWSADPDVGVCHDGISSWLAECRRRWADGTWEDGMPRVAKGVPNRVDKLKCLGNAVVPQQFYPIFKAIAEIEMGCSDGN